MTDRNDNQKDDKKLSKNIDKLVKGIVVGGALGSLLGLLLAPGSGKETRDKLQRRSGTMLGSFLRGMRALVGTKKKK